MLTANEVARKVIIDAETVLKGQVVDAEMQWVYIRLTLRCDDTEYRTAYYSQAAIDRVCHER